MKRFFPGRVRVGRTQAEPSPPCQSLLPKGWDATSPPPNHVSPRVASGCNCDSLLAAPRQCDCSAANGRNAETSKRSRARSFVTWFGAEKKPDGGSAKLFKKQFQDADGNGDRSYTRKGKGGDEDQYRQGFLAPEQGGGMWEDVGSATGKKEMTVRRKLAFPGRAVMKSFKSRAVGPVDDIPTVVPFAFPPSSRNGSPDENREPFSYMGERAKEARKGLLGAVPKREVLGVLEEKPRVLGVSHSLQRCKSALEIALETAVGSKSVRENETLRARNASGAVEPGRFKRPGTLKRGASPLPVAIQSPGGKYLKRLNDGVDTPVFILSAHSHGLPKVRRRSEGGLRQQSEGSAEGLVPGLSQLNIGLVSPYGGCFDAPKDSPPIWKRRRISCPRSIAVPLPSPPVCVQ